KPNRNYYPCKSSNEGGFHSKLRIPTFIHMGSKKHAKSFQKNMRRLKTSVKIMDIPRNKKGSWKYSRSLL
ncbi:hypothetical protein, partial [Caldibacillus thermoamylovorans]|uniref:hypothetical protein n=1 Tax=Caldibacillus thermoamylovorans TaxID=35841 RepID=UPI001F439F5C